jgi:diguanylate cyclase (GGDEF)-like protein
MFDLQSPRKRAILGSAIAVLFASFVALIGLILFLMRQDALERAQINLRSLHATAESGLTKLIHSFELSLDAVVTGLPKIEGENYSTEIRRAFLFDNSTLAPQFGSILVLDKSGDVILDSQGLNTRGLNFKDRDYFQTHVNGDAGLFVSKPFVSRISGNQAIALSRRLFSSDGKFSGIVVGTLKLSFVQELLDHLDVGEKGIAGLMRTDGIMLARSPEVAAAVGRDIRLSDLFMEFERRPAGLTTIRSRFDGEERLIAYSQIGDLPLLLSIGLAKSDILADWWRRAAAVAGVVLVLLAFAGFLLYLFWQEFKKRLRAERSLMKASRQLERLARTDALTKLANRRCFDMVFDREWRRHIRDKTAFSLLIIDVDHFKAYNDSLGHPAGDRALAQVARIIEGEAKRPADLAARYGGEEFAVILPDTSAQNAKTVAVRIWTALNQQRIPHPHGINGHLTISIGIASVDAGVSADDFRKLLETADKALYGAKRDGRNQINMLRLPSVVTTKAA